MKFFLLILKNLRRNLLRTILTGLGTVVLVFVVTLVWSVLDFLNKATQEKSQNMKMIVTERWQIPSQMPFSYASTLSEGAARNEGDLRPLDSMSWAFYGGTLDPTKFSPDNFIFAIATLPESIMTMMDDLDEMQPGPDRDRMFALCDQLKSNRQGIILGVDRLKKINKKVGERIKIYGVIYKDINLEFEILGTFPESIPRYAESAVFNRDYLYESLDVWPRTHSGQPHALAQKNMNIMWLRVPSSAAFEQISHQIENSPLYTSPAVKCQTLSSAISSFLDSYRDLIWGARYLLSPAILVTLSLVISNSISISVRERRKELAVLKVLGFQPMHLLGLVLGEALLIGTVSGFLSAAGTYFVINDLMGGLKLPIAFFQAFEIPIEALGWGLAIGVGTALVGSVVPALNARRVRVSDVFSKVA
jgi:putative ABC transport system permease protein